MTRTIVACALVGCSSGATQSVIQTHSDSSADTIVVDSSRPETEFSIDTSAPLDDTSVFDSADSTDTALDTTSPDTGPVPADTGPTEWSTVFPASSDPQDKVGFFYGTRVAPLKSASHVKATFQVPCLWYATGSAACSPRFYLYIGKSSIDAVEAMHVDVTAVMCATATATVPVDVDVAPVSGVPDGAGFRYYLGTSFYFPTACTEVAHGNPYVTADKTALTLR